MHKKKNPIVNDDQQSTESNESQSNESQSNESQSNESTEQQEDGRPSICVLPDSE